MAETVLLIVALLILMGWSAWMDTPWIAAITAVLYLAGSWMFGDLSHLAFLTDPTTLLASVAFSLAIGTLWSLWKWRRWMLSDQVQRALREGKDLRDKSDANTSFKDSIYFPKRAMPSHNVERIATWIVLWPFSMLVYFFEDLLMDVGRWVYERLGKVYSRITDAALSDDMKD